MIERPIHHEIDGHRDTVRLFFENKESAEFYVRGAVCWPEGTEAGFAVLGAQDVKTKTIWIFEGYSFLSIVPIFQKDKKTYNGFAEFLQRIWTTYGCYTLFWRQANDVHQRFALKCYDVPTIVPKPEFIKTPYAEDITAENLFKEMAARGQFRASKQGELYQNINNPDKVSAKRSLICLLAGFEYLPWIDVGERLKFNEYIL